MRKTTNPVLAARTDVANAVRTHRDPTPARRRLVTEKAKRAIIEALESPTAPTEEQRQELIALLGGGSK